LDSIGEISRSKGSFERSCVFRRVKAKSKSKRIGKIRRRGMRERG
jgi:hypothetical protein